MSSRRFSINPDQPDSRRFSINPDQLDSKRFSINPDQSDSKRFSINPDQPSLKRFRNIAESSRLDSVIRQVDRKTKASSSAQKIVIIDTSTGKEKRSFLATSFLGTDVKYYLISNTKDEQNYANRDGLMCYVKDPELDDMSLGLCINYHVSCNPGRETQVAEALWDNTHPGAELDRKIKKYVDNFFSFENDLINNFAQLINNLKQYITEKVHEEIGLNIQLSIRLENEEELTPLRISSPPFTVQFSDYAGELDLQFELELLIDESNKINALFYSGKRDLFEKLIQKEIKQYLLDYISVEEFYSNLDTTVRNKLISHLDNKVLTRYGRKVVYLALKSADASSKVEDFLEVEHQVNCKVQEELVIVKNTVQMMPENIGKYRMANSPALERWIKKRLDVVIKKILFDKKYVDILLDFESIREEIREEMVRCSQSIGYTVQHIVSIPDKLEELTKEFSLEVKGEFESRDSEVKVELSIVVDAKIENLKKIENLLNSRTNIKASMEAAIEKTVRSFLHTVEPERFYMRFSTTDDAYPEEELSVEKELEKNIREKLENEPFYVVLQNVTIKPLDTEVKRRFQALQGKFCKFKFEVLPFGGSEPVQFKGIIQVENVHKDSWYIFQSRIYSLEEIRDYLEESLKAKLQTYPNEVLEYKKQENLSTLTKLLNLWGSECIIDQFGLEVTLKRITRDHTKSEQTKAIYRQRIGQEKIEKEALDLLTPVEIGKQNIEYERKALSSVNEAKTSELVELLEQRKILKKRPGNEEAIDNINSQISELIREAEEKASKASASIEMTEETSNLLEPDKSQSTETSFNDILDNETKQISGRSDQQQINPASEENP